MGDMLIRGIPEALKTAIAAEAVKDGHSLSSEAIHLMREGLEARRSAKAPSPGGSLFDAMREIYRPEEDPEAAEQFAKIMDEIEAERKRDFGRPIPDFE